MPPPKKTGVEVKVIFFVKKSIMNNKEQMFTCRGIKR